MVCEPNTHMCGWDCEPLLHHPQTVHIPFTANCNWSIFCANIKRTGCAGCPFHASGVLSSPQVRQKLINHAPNTHRTRTAQCVSGTLVYTRFNTTPLWITLSNTFCLKRSFKVQNITVACNIVPFHGNCNTPVHLHMQPSSVTLMHNISLVQWQNTDIGWNRLMLSYYAVRPSIHLSRSRTLAKYPQNAKYDKSIASLTVLVSLQYFCKKFIFSPPFLKSCFKIFQNVSSSFHQNIL